MTAFNYDFVTLAKHTKKCIASLNKQLEAFKPGQTVMWDIEGICTNGAVVLFPNYLKASGKHELKGIAKKETSRKHTFEEYLKRVDALERTPCTIMYSDDQRVCVTIDGEILENFYYSLYWVRWLHKHVKSPNKVECFIRTHVIKDGSKNYLQALEFTLNTETVALIVPAYLKK